MLESRRWAFLFLAPLLLCQAAWAKPAILDIRLGIHPGSTRIVVELSQPTAYRVGLLAGPPRLTVELPASDWSSPRLPTVRGQISGLAMASSGGLTKLTAVLRGPAKLGAVMMIQGTTGGQSRRLVIDFLPATAGDFASALLAGPIDSAPPLVVSSLADTNAPTQAPASPYSSTADGSSSSAWSDGPPLLKPVSALVLPQATPSAQVPEATQGPVPAKAPVPTQASTSSPSPAPVPGPILASAITGAGSGASLLQNDAPSAAPAAWPPGVPMLKPMPANLPLIYIDPGHGGPDPGTIGHNGTYEKNVTLAIARELERQLLATGRYRVKLTRETDSFVALRTRFEMAREDRADLFISLHADSSFVGNPRGASVYTLSETSSDAEAAALATKENKADLIAGVDLTKQNAVVSSILIDLTQRETKNLSARLAGLMVDEMRKITLLLPNTHRFAGFAVLKAPDIPSVLIEMGYLSNVQDEGLLLSAEHRAKLAAAMLRAIDGYFAATVVSSRS